MATKYHNRMSGADLHPNAIDGTTGTELTPPSLAIIDGRYVRTIGGTVTPTVNSTATLKVNRQDGTTSVFAVDTTNNQVTIGTGSGGNVTLGDSGFSKLSGAFFFFNSGMKIAGPFVGPTALKTTAYTISPADSVIRADATAVAFTVTLPSFTT